METLDRRTMYAKAPTLTTDRLVLRAWCPADLAPFAELNADARVMRHFPELLTAAQSDALVARLQSSFVEHGFGLWAVARRDSERFIGMVGLSLPSFAAPFMPRVEIGWRLAAAQWGHGFAGEAARAALDHGFGEAGLEEVVSFTTPDNHASRRVMEKLGMRHDPKDDFEHPQLPLGHRLKAHVLYRLRRP